MAHQFPSIQSFFQPEVSTAQVQVPTPPSEAGDGFTSEEITSVLEPTLHEWHPRNAYEDTEIGALVPGPGCVTLTGRIVNLYDQQVLGEAPKAARGCLRLLVKDDTGVVSVKLWYAKIDYKLRLGQLLSIWTAHVSSAESMSLTLQNASIGTSIFPERDNSCYALVQEQNDDGTMYKTPMGYTDEAQLMGLMTVKNFAEGGYDFADAKVLVCVKSIGGRQKITTKKGNTVAKADVNVFDDTSEATLTLWGYAAYSARCWKTSHTVLLISRAGFKSDKRAMISLTSGTYVDVDPCMTDAYWLRGFAQRLTRRDHVNQPFPEVFDIDEAEASQVKILFTLADIDEFARAAPAEIYMGYLSVMILEINVMHLYQRHMLLCTECCGVPLFANSTSAKCKHCRFEIPLRINPRLMGTLVDETGSINCGKLVWSTSAWEQLLGRTAKDLVDSSTTLLKYLEQRLLFSRVSLIFGWSEEVGKLAVCGVRM